VTHPLDSPVFSSLTGAHARFAERRGRVLRYPVDVSPFLALPDEPGETDWTDAAALVGPGGLLPLTGVSVPPPAGWPVVAARSCPARSSWALTWGSAAAAGSSRWPGNGCTRQDWTEISAVCTDEAWRGRGLARRLIRAVGAGIRARGETPFLHAVATNPAIALYERLDFRHRKATLFTAVRVPEAPVISTT
jgi:GNAT superfamily N-acetyltransferase